MIGVFDCVLPAARRGETKFHDPSRAIYLSSVSRRSKSHKGSGFLLSNIGTAPGNRLANGFVQDRASGNWRNSAPAARHPEIDVNETERLKPAAEQQVRLNLVFEVYFSDVSDVVDFSVFFVSFCFVLLFSSCSFDLCDRLS